MTAIRIEHVSRVYDDVRAGSSLDLSAPHASAIAEQTVGDSASASGERLTPRVQVWI